MKRFYAFFVALCLPLTLMAQYNDIAYSSSSNANIIQIDQYDDVSVFHFSYTSAGTEELYVDMGMKISIKGTSQTYKLVDADNIPTNKDVNSFIKFKKAGETLNFILMFEKLPVDKPFDIDANMNGSGCNVLNFKNVTVNQAIKAQLVDNEKFLKNNKAMINGTMLVEGKEFQCSQCDGLSIGITPVFMKESKIQRIFIVMLNETGRNVQFKFNNLRAVGYDADGNVLNLKVQTCEEYLKQLKNENFWIKAATLTSITGAVSSIASGSHYGASMAVSTSAFVVMCSLQENGASKEYREAAEYYYAKDKTLANKEDVSCYFNIKDIKKMVSCAIEIDIDGKTFEVKVPIVHKNN